MTPKKFNTLPLSLKYKLIRHNGKYLTEIPVKGDYISCLFQMPDFYAEVLRDKGGTRILHAKAFSEYKRLTPYLEHFNIRTLLK